MILDDSTLLRDLGNLDPATGWPGADRATAERTRAWIRSHDRITPKAVPSPARRTGRHLVLAGTAAVVVLGLVGVLPSLVGDDPTTAPAAAIPMLDFEHPDGDPAGDELSRLAVDLRAAASASETGPYFFSHWRGVRYAMGETEVSDGNWEVDRLVRREFETYRWGDTADQSGGQLYVAEGVPDHVTVFAPGEEWPGSPASPADTAEELLAETTRFGGTAGDYPGNYLLTDYTHLAPRLSVEERATFLDAFALAGDVTSYGDTTDRLGREGVAFGATRVVVDDGTEVRIETVLILDPSTGITLEEDTVFPNDLPGAPGIVEEYRLLVESGYHEDVPPCGDQACPGVETTSPAARTE